MALLLRLAFLFLLFLCVGVDLFYIFQGDICHVTDFDTGASADLYLATARVGARRITAGLHTAAPQVCGLNNSFPGGLRQCCGVAAPALMHISYHICIFLRNSALRTDFVPEFW